MGGNVFLVPARRLSTPQLLSLLKLVKGRLDPFFEGMEITRFFGEKDTHGDLDVLCGLWMGGDGWKGADQEGAIDPAATDAVPLETAIRAHTKSGLGKQEEKAWTKEQVAGFSELVARKLGATKWRKHGWEVSFAIPCAVLEPETTDTGPEAVSLHPKFKDEDVMKTDHEQFYQLDLLLVRPPSLSFAVMTQSYGVSALLLSAALRRMSSSFTIHTDRFVVRYPPYHGLPAVEVDLTHDPVQFMEWAGLDHARWQQGFATERDFWQWLACLPDNVESLTADEQAEKKDELFKKRFAQGWKRLAKQKQGQKDNTKMPKGHSKARVEVMERFRAYIKSTLYADTPVPEPTADAEVDKVAGDLGAASIEPLSSPALSKTEPPPVLDPASPRGLSDRAQDALTYFCKINDWHTLLDQRRAEAFELAERQQRRFKEKIIPSSTVIVGKSSTITTTDTCHGLVVVHEKIETMRPDV